MAVRIIADSFAMTARSSAAVLQARTLRMRSRSFIDMVTATLLQGSLKTRTTQEISEPESESVTCVCVCFVCGTRDFG